MPYLADAPANLFCKMEAVAHFGTHIIFIGRVEDVRFAAATASPVYQDGHCVTTCRLVDA